MKTYPKDLLEAIKEELKLDMISDLVSYPKKRKIEEIMNHISREAYSDRQWEDAEKYCGVHKDK
ncbi:hypothetical protein [Frisingicoccus sp.]